MFLERVMTYMFITALIIYPLINYRLFMLFVMLLTNGTTVRSSIFLRNTTFKYFSYKAKILKAMY